MPPTSLSIYEPTMDTLYIRHGYKIGYETYVEEVVARYYVEQTTQPIINQSCLDGGST
ncbi:hypothetical protein [Alkalihalobacillus pseudalcaliphilus]|uniref:hypothetical protein n=1 Tax=Alkalihalobacillus pseudalcaliphilus TaxID=79884 RepID=UPI000B34056D|nr:hypothetical protein [Alkalihalobacillus pseudalcaliphilus]